MLYFLRGNALCIVDGSVAVGESNNFAPQFNHLFGSKLSHITGTADGYGFPFKAFAFGLQHFYSKIYGTVTGRFGTEGTSTKIKSFTGKGSGELITQTLVLTVHIGYFATTYTNITGGYVGIGTNMTVKLGDKGLAELHDFVVGLSFGVEVGTTFTTTHGQRGETVFQNLLKSQKFKNTQVHRCVKTNAPLVRTDGTVHLHPETTVNLHFTAIIQPGHPKHNHPLGFGHTFQNFIFHQSRILHYKRSQTLYYLMYSLVEFGLSRIAGNNTGHKIVNETGYLVFHLLKI